MIIVAAKAGKLLWVVLNIFAAKGEALRGRGRTSAPLPGARILGALAAALKGHTDDEMRIIWDLLG